MININNDVFRYERKFLLDKFSINSLEDLIQYTPCDLYEKYQERKVNSIYYDNSNFSLAYENIDGIFNRSKIRVRYYGNSNKLSSPKLEIKSKYGNVENNRKLKNVKNREKNNSDFTSDLKMEVLILFLQFCDQ